MRKVYYNKQHDEILDLTSIVGNIVIADHMNGFDNTGRNTLLDHISKVAVDVVTVWHDEIIVDGILQNYPNLNFKFLFPIFIWEIADEYPRSPRHYQNFVCSFNGSPHISRQFLTAAIHKFNWFDPQYTSKNFISSRHTIDGNLQQYCLGDTEAFYRKFIIDETAQADTFYNSKIQLAYDPETTHTKHSTNIQLLEKQINQSFVHVVSETLATSYYPFVTEKFLYSILNKGLFITYGQPNWHAHIEKYYGFKLYKKIFNYSFDSITNPVERLVEMLTMISKFSMLSRDELDDLYRLEHETIEFNYNHYKSGDYIKCLEKHNESPVRVLHGLDGNVDEL